MRLRILLATLLALCVGAAIDAQTWVRMGPEGGMVVSLGADSGKELYLGAADGHIFASTDAAISWELRGRVGTRIDAVVTRILVDPRNSSRLLAAVWYQEAGAGGGVFASEDQGRSWKLVGLNGEAVRALERAPSNPDELVAGTRTGVFLSSDSGKSWAQISPTGDQELKNLDSLAIDPRDPQVIYAGTYHLPWLTRDAGKTWKPVVAGIIDDSDIMSLRLDASNPDRVYMSACSGIYRSENQGGEWIKLQGIPYAARRTQVIVQDTANPKALYAGTTEGLWVTRDGGESWARTTSKDWAVNSLIVLPGKAGAAGRVVMGTEGQGVLISDDAGENFVAANRGFTHVIVKQLLADERNPQNLIMIAERGAAEILKSADDGKSWSSFSLKALDQGKSTALNAGIAQEIYSSQWGWMLRYEDGRLWRWDDSQQSWKEWLLRLPPAAQPKPRTGTTRSATRSVTGSRLRVEGPIVFSNMDALVATNQGLLRCLDSGACLPMKAFGRGQGVRAVWISKAGSEIGVVMDGKFAWSADGGVSAGWRDIPAGAEHVLWIDVSSDVKKTVFLGTNEGVFLSVDENPWQRISGGLPPGQVGPWLRLPEVWAISERDGGLYTSRDHGHSWRRVNSDAEKGRFTGLARAGDGAILAGSQSEGLLKLKFEESPQTVP